MLFKNILVPFDNSKFSMRAFKVALDIAEKYNSKLTIATCIHDPGYTGDWYTDSHFVAKIVKDQKKTAAKFLSQPQLMAKKRGIKIRTSVLEGESVVKKIVSFAKSQKIDLIVMGSHGRTGWNKLMLGSVANGVLNASKIPVLIIR